MTNELNMPRSKNASLAGIVVAVVIAIALAVFVLIRLSEHNQLVTAASNTAERTMAVATKLQSASDALSKAQQNVASDYDAIKSGFESASDLGSLAVVREKLDDARTDHAVPDAISRVRQILGASIDGELNSDLDSLAERNEHLNDQLLSLSTTMQELLNNPLLALGLSSEDGKTAADGMITALRDERTALGTAITRIGSLVTAANAAHASAVAARDAQRAKNVFVSIITP